MREARPLVFDLGFHDGSDTDYFLQCGCRVVAVEADPALVRAGVERFASARDRVTILHAAVAATPRDVVPFYVSAHTLWSSVEPEIAAREGLQSERLLVPAATLPSLIDEYGVPLYCKIDLEGADAAVVSSLAASDRVRPRFVSAEAESVGDAAWDVSDEEALRALEALRAAGYTRFKLVDQLSLAVLGDDFRFYPRQRRGGLGHRLEWRRAAIARRRLHRRLGYAFGFGATGPWGEQLAGGWVDAERARRRLLGHRAAFFSADVPAYGFWCDWHATR
jgi:FkbM family methyltransferase